MYEIFGITDVGCVREHNEDAFLIQKIFKNHDEYYLKNLEGNWIAAVADGMGGQAAGEVASELALRHLANIEVPITIEELNTRVLKMNEEIVTYGDKNQLNKGLGTTLTGLICTDHQLTLYHVGDSRVYRFRDGYLKQLSQDHSLVEALYQQGQITNEEKNNHPQRHILLRSLGLKNNKLTFDIEKIRGYFEIGDTFLICSDGLNVALIDEKIESILTQYVCEPLEQLARQLIMQAKEVGGEDNITVVAIRRIY
jgi:PPM family protein phosphatase